MSTGRRRRQVLADLSSKRSTTVQLRFNSNQRSPSAAAAPAPAAPPAAAVPGAAAAGKRGGGKTRVGMDTFGLDEFLEGDDED